MNFISRLLMPFIKDIVKEQVQQEFQKLSFVDQPKIRKITRIRTGRKPNVWEILDGEFSYARICIVWIDKNGLDDPIMYNADDLAELKNVIETMKPREDLFSSVSIHAFPIGSSSFVMQTLIGASFREEEFYTSADLPKVFEPVIDWINERPELLI